MFTPDSILFISDSLQVALSLLNIVIVVNGFCAQRLGQSQHTYLTSTSSSQY